MLDEDPDTTEEEIEAEMALLRWVAPRGALFDGVRI